MYGQEYCSFSFWWIIPVLMIILCIFMMRGRRGSMMCGFGSCGTDKHIIDNSKSPMEILDKRFALGEINKEEYQEAKRTLTKFSETGKHQN